MNYPIATDSLSLCPFCNGKPCYLQQEDLHKIRCTHCGAEVKAETSDNAVHAWNIRARSRQTPMASAISALGADGSTRAPEATKSVHIFRAPYEAMVP
jgi:Restriction alleviation protein Lar